MEVATRVGNIIEKQQRKNKTGTEAKASDTASSERKNSTLNDINRKASDASPNSKIRVAYNN